MWPVLAPVSFGARRLREGVSLFVSLATAIRWAGLCCLSHWCCYFSSKNFFADIPNHNFFQTLCLFCFLKLLGGYFILPVRYLFRFQTFNELKAYILQGARAPEKSWETDWKLYKTKFFEKKSWKTMIWEHKFMKSYENHNPVDKEMLEYCSSARNR